MFFINSVYSNYLIKVLNPSLKSLKFNQHLPLPYFFQKTLFSKIVPIQDPKFTENDYLFSIIESKYSYNLFDLTKQISLPHPISSLNQFLNLSSQDDMYKINFNNVTSQLIHDLKYCNNNELKSILKKLIKDFLEFGQEWFKNLDQYSVLWNHIDYIFYQRLESLSNDEFLVSSTFQECIEISHLFYSLKVPRVSKFINLFVQKIDKANLTLTKFDFVKIMFIINLSRNMMSPNLKKWAQNHFLALLAEMNIEEIAIVCSAFFKTQTPFDNAELVNKIMKRTIADIKIIQSAISLSCILKALGYSKVLPDLALTKALTSNCLKNFEGLNFTNINHLVTLVINHHYYCPEFIDLALSNMEAHVSELRIKEVERIIKSCVHFNHLQPPYKQISNIIDKRKPLIEKDLNYPQSFCALLRNLTVFEIYPEDMVKKFLQPEFIENLIEKTKGGFLLHILTLKDAIKLDCYPKYEEEINKIEEIVLQHSKLSSFFSPLKIQDLLSSKSFQLSPNEKLLIKCYLSIKEIYQDQVVCKNILSFTYFPEIVITSEKNNLKQLNDFKMIPNAIKSCTVVVIQYKSHFNDETCEHYLGFQRLRVRLLLKLGFNVVLVPYYEIIDLHRKKLIRHFDLKLNIPINR